MCRNPLAWILTFATLAAIHPHALADGNVDLPRFPSVSPDGSSIAFSWRGDLWVVPATGGQAVRLTSHGGNDLRSAWSPDGTRIAFDSTRDGYQNIHIMNADGTNVRQVTNTDQACTITGFGRDDDGCEMITFDARMEGDVYRSKRPYMISVEGGDMMRLHDAFGSMPVMDSSGRYVAFTRGGYYYGWPRRKNFGPESMDVWVHDRQTDTFTQVTSRRGNDGSPRWAGPETLVYLSDQDFDHANLFRIRRDTPPERLTSFRDDPIQHFDVSADGRSAVMVVWDTIYTLDLTRRGAPPVALTINAAEDESDRYAVKSIDREVSEAALSPDGTVMAYIAYGEVYVREVEDKAPTRRVTESHSRERNPAWSPDGLVLYFVSDRDGTDSIYRATVELTRTDVKDAVASLNAEEEPAPEPDDHDGSENGDDDEENGDKDEKKQLPRELDPERWRDAIRFNVEAVVAGDDNDREPQLSPDGTHLSFRRGRGDLVVRDLENGAERTLVTGWDTSLDWRWSPDSGYIAYSQADMNFNDDIFIVPADGSADPVNITRHPDSDTSPRFSADGKILAFASERINEETDIWMVYLDPSLEKLTAPELEKYYNDAVEAVGKRKPLSTKPDDDDDEEGEDEQDGDETPAEIQPGFEWDDLATAYLRVRRVTTFPGSEGSLELTPGGDRYVFTGSYGESGLYSIKWDGDDRTRLRGIADVQHLSLTGDQVVYVADGQAGTVPPGGGDAETHPISDSITIELAEQSTQKFHEAARVLGEQFYHPDMKGLDWVALTDKYLQLAVRARTAEEFSYIGNYFLGELAGSHLGIRGSDPQSPNAQAHGQLGIRSERVTNGYRVTHVIAEGPADIGPMKLEVGDVITTVDSDPFGPTDTLHTALEGRVNKETLFDVTRTLEDGTSADIQVLLTPTSAGAIGQLVYREWRHENARLVDQWSDGRLGYIHIQGMNQPSLDVFERDLFAACDGKEGLVIDVRNNGGGWTADRLLASIMVRPHAYTIPRGADPNDTGHYPQPRLFIQRYTLPTAMLCNEKSFSNAEITSHAYKTLGRGTLVGQETWGGVISTGGFQLIDGTFVRLPFRGWYLLDGTDMENNGAVPDIIVDQTPEAESAGDDEQLRAAVQDLLNRL